MKFILLLIINLQFLISNCFSQSGWFQLNSGISDNLYSVYFINSVIGFIVGNDKILKTTSGGINWDIQIISNAGLRGVRFLNQTTGYAAGSFGVVMKTTNTGVNWIHIDAGLQGDLNSVFFLDSQTGLVTGWLETGFILRTTNGGTNWSYVSTGGLIPYDIDFINASTGFTGYAPGFLNKTTNGGSSWFSIPTGTSSSVYSLQFINDLTGYASGSAVIKTTNGGNNWLIQLTGSTYPYFYSIYFVSPNKGYTAGALNSTDNFIMATTNGGNNWLTQYSSPGLLLGIFFPDTSTGYCVGENGMILKTTNGGLSFVKQISNGVPKTFTLYQNYPNPFNPSTKIKFSLPSPSQRVESSTEGGEMSVRLVIYDVLGKEVAVLIPAPGGGQERLKPGSYQVEWNASSFPSGIYFYKLITDGFVETKKMVLVK